MIHHGPKDYNVAASEAAKVAREKMTAIIDKGNAKAGQVINTISNTIIDDYLAGAPLMKFEPKTDGSQMQLVVEGSKSQIVQELHRNALYQAMSIAKGPNAARNIDWFFENDAQDELGSILTKNFKRHENRRHLIRSVGGQSRAILSNSFKRMDGRHLLDKFVEGCQIVGAQPYDGFCEDTRLTIRAILPYIFEPVPNEVMVFGLEWQTSDYGHGANVIRLFMMRMWCTNLAMANDVLRQIHLGKRLDESVNFSTETLRLESEMMASMMKDVIQNALGPGRVDEYLNAIKKAAETDIKGDFIKTALKREGLTKAQAQEVVDAFSSNDIEMLPPGQNLWRASNALSWVAQKKEDNDERFLFERAAGRILPAVDVKAIEVAV